MSLFGQLRVLLVLDFHHFTMIEVAVLLESMQSLEIGFSHCLDLCYCLGLQKVRWIECLLILRCSVQSETLYNQDCVFLDCVSAVYHNCTV